MVMVDPQKDEAYGGYNPAFAARVRERRRAAQAVEIARRKEVEERVRQARLKEEMARATERLRIAQEALDKAKADSAETVISAGTDLARVNAAMMGFTWAEITQKLKGPPAVIAVRDQCIRIVADAYPSITLAQLGEIFGGRHHATIINSLKKTRKPGQAR